MQAAHQGQGEVVRTVVGFVLLLGLAWVAGHSRLAAFERRVKVNPLILTGTVFLILGLLASIEGVGILSGSMLAAIAPVVPLGLGFLGFRIGFDFDRKVFDTRTAAGVLLSVLIPMLLAVALGGGIVWLSDRDWAMKPEFWRDLLLASITTAMTSMVSIRALIRRRAGAFLPDRISAAAELEQTTALAALMFIAIIFRQPGVGVGWQLPALAWLFVTLGVGMAMGLLTYALLCTAQKGPPFIVILLGALCMAAGMASFLRLSTIGVCFVVGLIVSNLPGSWKEQVDQVLQRMGKPVVYLLLLVAGAMWVPWDWRGWVLTAILVAARIGGKWISFRLARWQGQLELSAAEQRATMLAPTGVLAIAVILSAKDLYADAQTPILLTATIGGALLCELLLAVAFPAGPRVEQS